MPSAKISDQKVALGALLLAFFLAAGVAAHRLKEIRAHNAEILQGGTDPGQWPCASDARIFCAGVPEGGGHVNACLEEHARDLSHGCAQFRENTDGADDWVGACDPELRSLCAGRHHQMQCLKENQGALSAHCRSRISNYEEEDHWRRACAEDAAQYCPNSNQDDSRKCLTNHFSQLTPSCRAYYGSQYPSRS